MAIVKTHTGLVVISKGEKRFKIHEMRSSWVVGRNESYDKHTGFRWGAERFRRRLLLDSIKPIKTEAA
ncbi:hypothetical protein RA241_003717 [Cronobacter sakazakii]|nr:hypothetical protein [Cronobacter sakazakii]